MRVFLFSQDFSFSYPFYESVAHTTRNTGIHSALAFSDQIPFLRLQSPLSSPLQIRPLFLSYEAHFSPRLRCFSAFPFPAHCPSADRLRQPLRLPVRF